MEFRKTFLGEMGVDPFCYCTIAAAVMAVYRSKYLKEKSIGIIPKKLYRDGNKPFSKTSIEWLEFIAAQTNSKILHAVHGGEKTIVDEELGKTYYVDGFCEETGTVYEFMVVCIMVVLYVLTERAIIRFIVNGRCAKFTRRQLNVRNG